MKFLDNLFQFILNFLGKKRNVFKIYFKRGFLEKEWEELVKRNFQLVQIIEEVAKFIDGEFGKKLIITSIYRKKIKDSGIHGLWRAVDIRSFIFTKEEIIKILRFVNSKYVYDPRRLKLKVAIFHNVGLGPHFHFQNCKNTQRIK